MTVSDQHPSLPSLLERTECGGCAAKLGAGVLADALAGLAGVEAPDDLLVGLAPADDAAVYRVDDGLAVLGTVDFFPPVVDDPFLFGSIAAANAVSDIFAMGGRVAFGLAISALPEDLPLDLVREIFRGAAETMREAGGVLAGGHTVRDPEPKYGVAVVGFAHPDHLLRKGGAVPGDQLILTKRLGTGLVISGRRSGHTTDPWLAEAVVSMRTLNRRAGELLVRHGVRGATDVTGFGLIGHGLEMATAGGVSLHFRAESLPLLPGARRLAEMGVETGGAAHNRRFAAGHADVGAVDEPIVALAFDPQTSGGMLAAVPPSRLDTLSTALTEAGVEWAHVGVVEDGEGVLLRP
jgi:selenide,water dikinase